MYEYLNSWGIAVNDDIAVESNSRNTIAQLGVVLADYGESDITKTLSDNSRYIGYFPYSKSLQLLFTENNGIKVEAVLTTSDNSYSTTDFSSLENVSGSTGKQVIAAAATKQGDTTGEDAVIFVSGNSAMMEINEQSIAGYGFANYDYIKNVLTFLHGTYEDYSITPKYLTSGKLMMNSNTDVYKRQRRSW